MKILLRQIFAISIVTSSEIIREKILWSTVIFALLLIALSLAVAELSLYEPERIALDFGSAAISISGSLLAIVIGGGLISREIRNRTSYLVLSKSIWRWQFVLGKLGGLYLVLMLNVLAMNIVLLVVYFVAGGSWHINLFYNMILQSIEFLVLASVATLFSCYSTALIASVLTSGFWLIGHIMDDVHIAIKRITNPWISDVLTYVVKIMPDLTLFDIKPELSHGIPVPPFQVLGAIVYGVMFSLFAASIACSIFSRRDL